MNKTIAIDGPAGSGKSSIAKLFAKSIDFFYLDTGSLYRSVTSYLKQKNIATNQIVLITKEFKNIKINFDDKGEVFLNNENISKLIRSKEITKAVASYAQIPEIRNFVRILQKNFAAQKNIVIDGRDIGTVVFPDAFCKFYLDANIDIRVQRRFEDLKKLNMEESLDKIKSDIMTRDYVDRYRKESSLKISPDAIVIDTTNMTIDEVLNSMLSYYDKQCHFLLQQSFLDNNKIDFLKSLQEYENSFKREDKIIEGVVIKINDQVLIDIGAKQDAYIDKEEINTLEKPLLKGEKINVVIVGQTSLGIKVSKKKAEQVKSYSFIKKAKENKTPINGKVKRIVKGGFIIDIMSNDAFCPFSEYDIRKINHNLQLNKKSDFLILEYKIGKFIVSRKRIIEKIFQKNRQQFFENAEVEQVYKSKVIVILNYGIFVEIEPGVDALIRNRDIVWKRFQDPSEVVSYGDEFEVKIIYLDKENHKIIASKKILEENPFDMFLVVHKIGDIVKGKIRKIHDYGCFIDIFDGVSGLLKVSDLNWLRRIEHPEEVVKNNQEIEVKIIRIDKNKKLIDLGLKQMQENPWNSIHKKYPIHSLVKVKVIAIVRNGIYGIVNQEVDVFLHIDDSKLEGDEKDLSKIYHKGDILEARILRINPSKHRLELKFFKTDADAWKNIENNYGPKDPIYGEVVEILEKGVNVKITDEVIGFCHISQITDKKDEFFEIESEMKIGKQYAFFIQSINSDKKDIKLSRKDYLLAQVKNNPKNYLNNSGVQSKITISDLLK
jgi:small subunit ribosomal protein S1